MFMQFKCKSWCPLQPSQCHRVVDRLADGDYPFPTPDWYFSNQSWADEQNEIYYENRTGEYSGHCALTEKDLTSIKGPRTIPYLSGSIVAYLPLQNATDSWQDIVDSATSVDARSVLEPVLGSDIDETILTGYKAQAELILDLYKSAHATAMEVAWGGGNTVPIAMLKPLSRGVITINSTDPTAPPIFDYGTFQHPADLDIAVECLKKTREWMASAPMQEVGASETYPGTNVTTDAQIAASIRKFATSTWSHPTSSLSMMRRELGGVVDEELKVYGVKGLRVVDASIMPVIIGSHTSSTVYAVAEKVQLSPDVSSIANTLLICHCSRPRISSKLLVCRATSAVPTLRSLPLISSI